MILTRTVGLSIFLIALMISGLAFINLTSCVVAETTGTVNGIITSDETWTKDVGPYTLTGPVAVNEGATLTIEPGVTVNLQTYYIRVNGTLMAKGADDDKITFNSKTADAQINFNPNSTSWNESTNSGSIIQNAVLNGGISIHDASPKIDKDSITGHYLFINGGSPTISNSKIKAEIHIVDGSPTLLGNDINGFIVGINRGTTTIANNTITGHFSDVIDGAGICCNNVIITGDTITQFQIGVLVSGTSTIERNLFINNVIGIQVGVPGNGGGDPFPITIQNNLFTDNSKGINIPDLSQYSKGSIFTPVIQNNNFQNNRDYNFYLGLAASVNATYNWWGTTDTQAINQTIYDNKNDFNLGTVTFVPFLSEPDSHAPTTSKDNPAPSPTPTSTPNQTSSASGSTPENPTETPQLPNIKSDVFFGFDWQQTSIILLSLAVAVLLVVLILVFRKRNVRQPNFV